MKVYLSAEEIGRAITNYVIQVRGIKYEGNAFVSLKREDLYDPDSLFAVVLINETDGDTHEKDSNA